jgi:NAD(P)-binding Rossmann-like domain
MSDPIVEALRPFPYFFVLTAKGYSPISIRDQMVRAQILVTRAFEQREISRANTNPVLVVGAGAAGIAAALTLLQLRVRTEVVEKGSLPFLRQAGCSTRWVDPMQYDWPADQWSPGSTYPHGATWVPLPWTADWAYRLAIRWRLMLRAKASGSRGLLLYTKGIRVTSVSPVPYGPRPAFLSALFSSGSSKNYQAVIWAAGFGTEKCTITDERSGTRPSYTGPDFWANDALQSPGCGSANPSPRIVIVGGGDGGVQDLLRALTKHNSVRDIMSALPIDPTVLRKVQSVEERAHRHWIWAGTNGEHDHTLYQRLDQVHRDAASEALSGGVLDTHLAGMLIDPVGKVRENVLLIHRCTHLNCLYGLNRFLAYLLNAFLVGQGFWPVLVPQRSAVGVDSPPFGRHQIDTVPHLLCYDRVDATQPSIPEPADVIIVRYGIDVSSAVPPTAFTTGLHRLRHSIPLDPLR